MIARLVVGGAALAVVVGTASTALAQDQVQVGGPQPLNPQTSPERRSYLDKRLEAPKGAFELTLGTGYTQPFGMVQGGVGFPSVAEAGIGVDVGIGDRITPHWSVTISGQYNELNAQRGTGTRGLVGGVDVAYHMAPYARLDPYVQLGTGYRFLWETFPGTAPTTLVHGFELGRLALGADLRTSPDVAIGPMIGADLNLFTWQSGGGNNIAIASPRVSTFVYAGLQARFDVGGARARADVSAPNVASR